MGKLAALASGLCAVALMSASVAQPLSVASPGTAAAHLTYGGRPLFAFGPMNEHIVWQAKLGSDLYDARAWAQWQHQNGMNYVRCYPASGYGWTHEVADNPGYLFPFAKVSDDPVKFDINQFNPEYWDNFRAVGEMLKSHGIIVHLQIFQLCYFETRAGFRWPYNFWNPKNNVNGFTRDMKPNGGGHHPIIEQVVDGNHPRMREHYLEYLDHLLAAVGDLGNVFFDLSNEMGDGGLDLELAKKWVELTLDHIESWERRTGHDILVGQDIACFPDKDYLLAHPRMELAIIHGNHLGHDWTRFQKPIVIVNSNDGRYLGYADEGQSDRLPRFRKLHWRALLQRVQGVGDYQKNWQVEPGSVPQFDRDARLLREFFESITDYANLMRRDDCVAAAPASHSYCLASDSEAIVYTESGPRRAHVEYGSATLQLRDLPFADNRIHITIYNPKAGAVREIDGRVANGSIQVDLPPFTDDMAVHLVVP